MISWHEMMVSCHEMMVSWHEMTILRQRGFLSAHTLCSLTEKVDYFESYL